MIEELRIIWGNLTAEKRKVLLNAARKLREQDKQQKVDASSVK